MAETPFTPEQLQKLTEISRLPPEEQKKVLPEFLKILSPEQIKYLQEQQQTPSKSAGTTCPFCMISQKQLQSVILYEDSLLMAVLDIRPATKGHTILFPKQHSADFTSLPSDQVAQLFTVGQKLAGILEELEGCEGVNLFVANGTIAGQTVDHVMAHVIPRYKDDNVQLTWEGKPTTPETLQQIYQQLAPKLPGLVPQPKEIPTVSQQPPSDDLVENDEEPFADF